MQTPLMLEVEIRFHFSTAEEAFRHIPFLERSLVRRNDWVTDTYGRELYATDRLLRTAEVTRGAEKTSYLGYKGPDTGTFANIRQEIDEDITDGISGSAILALLGGNTSLPSAESVAAELDRLGHSRFMSFSGDNRTGYDDDLKIYTKLMTCSQLRWPLIVELEKEAANEDQARKREDDLRQLTNHLNLTDRLVREEPPTLLYQALFGEKTAEHRE